MAAEEFKVVHERREDSLHGPEHGAQAQVEEHQEKQRGPEGAGREDGHDFSERYECQARPLNALRRHKEEAAERLKLYTLY